MRVFISHSSRSERGYELAKEVHRRLEGNGYHPQVDVVDLRSGDRWREIIDSWLSGCDAAIVLLDKAALKSSWVAYELATLRTLEKQAETRGRSCPKVMVVLDGVSVEKVAKADRFDPHDLTATQLPNLDLPQGDEDIEAAAKAIVDHFDRERPAGRECNPLDRQADYLAGRLGDVGEQVVRSIDGMLTDIRKARDAGQGWLPGVRDGWPALRADGRDATPTEYLANWLLQHALVQEPHPKGPIHLVERACRHLPRADGTDTHVTVDTIFSGWVSTVVAEALLKTDGGYVCGGLATFRSADLLIARLCFLAALARDPLAAPRGGPPYLVVTSQLGPEDEDPHTLHGKIEKEFKLLFGIGLEDYLDGSRPLGVAFPLHETVMQTVESIRAKAAATNDHREPLAQISFLLTGSAEQPATPMALYQDAASQENLDEFATTLATLMEKTLSALNDPGLQPRQAGGGLRSGHSGLNQPVTTTRP